MIKFSGKDFKTGQDRTVYLSSNSEFAYEPYNATYNAVTCCAGTILVTTPMEELLKLAVENEQAK